MSFLRSVLPRAFVLWLPLAVATTFLCGLVYAVVQQAMRSSADDPQIQMAEDAAARLDAGIAPSSLVPGDAIDIASSLAPYVIIFDDHRQPLASDAVLGGTTPVPPAGVFAVVRGSKEDRITWQPAPGVRSAIVVTRSRQGFVLAGRSLRLVEERESNAEAITGVLWIVTLGAGAVASVAAAWLWQKLPPHSGI